MLGISMTSELQLQVLWYGVATSSGTHGARKAPVTVTAEVTKGKPRQVHGHGRKPAIWRSKWGAKRMHYIVSVSV